MKMAAEEKPVAVSVALCDCASTLARTLDFEHLKKVAEGEGAVGVERVGVLCAQGKEALAERLKAQRPDVLVVAGCSEEWLEPGLAGVLEQAGLAPNMVAVANLKEQCRGLTGALATAKASAVLRQAIEKARLLRPLEERPVEMTAAVLVVGGGWTGLKAAQELIAAGYKVALVEKAEEVGNPARQHLLSPEERAGLNAAITAVRASEMPVLTECELVSCRGVAGAFEVRLSQRGEPVEGRVGAIIVAPCLELSAPFEALGLTPADNVISSLQLEQTLSDPKAKAKLGQRSGLKAAFLVGLVGQEEAGPAVTEQTIRSALALTEAGAKTFVFSRDLRMASQGLEALTLKARQAGVLFFKFTDSRPAIEQQDGALKLTFIDEILTEELELAPDLLVVAEQWHPSAQLARLADTLGLAKGPQGFAQADNVHLFPVEDNREGIFVVGPAKGPAGLRECWGEAQVAASRVKTLLREGQVRPVKVTVDRGKCTICLTCARFCPHGAISWDNRAVIMPSACQGCGICAAECPMEALQVQGATDAQIEAELAAWETGTDLLRPRLVSFCCQRSAYPAMGLAVELGHSLPAGLQVVRVPCAGKVDVDYILKALQSGADGVMVLGCHEDNCRSLRGNTYASWRVEAVQRLLGEVGLEPERVAFASIASNMGSEFARLVNGMEERLRALGAAPAAGVEAAEARPAVRATAT
jgi:heterodisulfide reductase subunit A-like polyferredoxin/coenzyme F420-reducing hydrogenase delta subunit